MKMVVQILPECKRRFRKLQIANPNEIIRLADDMFQLADTYRSAKNFKKAEFWYRKIVTAKQKLRWYKPLETLKDCVGVVDSMKWQSRYFDIYEVLKDFIPSIQKVLPPDHYFNTTLKRIWVASSRNSSALRNHEREYNALVELLQTCLRNSGMRHETTPRTLSDLGKSLTNGKSFRDGEAIFTAALDLCHTSTTSKWQHWTMEAVLSWSITIGVAKILRGQRKFTEADS